MGSLQISLYELLLVIIISVLGYQFFCEDVNFIGFNRVKALRRGRMLQIHYY